MAKTERQSGAETHLSYPHIFHCNSFPSLATILGENINTLRVRRFAKRNLVAGESVEGIRGSKNKKKQREGGRREEEEEKRKKK